ncbi:MAG TPA: GAF domain-containing protein [Terriglobales bacterium]|nr:GAF domain-containing protein [Terriglobales bacterium]
MDRYSIIEPPSPQQKGNGVAPEEIVPEAGSEPVSPLEIPGAESSPTELLLEDNEAEPQELLLDEPPKSDLAQSAPDLDSALQSIVQKAQYISSASGAAIALRQDGEVVCRAASGSTAPDRGARLEIKSGLTAECLRSGEMMRCDNAMLDPRVDLESCKRLGIESIIIMPIQQGKDVAGVLELFSAHAYSFQDRDVETVKALADEISRMLEEEGEAQAERLQEVMPSSPFPQEDGCSCVGCGAKIAADAVFCTECGTFQDAHPSPEKTSLSGGWKERLTGRRLLVPAVFVAMALIAAVMPVPRAAKNGSDARIAPQPAATGAPASTASQQVSASTASKTPAANDPAGSNAQGETGIAKSVKQVLGGVSSDFSKILPVNEQAEPASNGDPNLRVWVDTRKGFYYCPGDEQYGHTEKGAYMTQKQAESNYYTPALIKPCS